MIAMMVAHGHLRLGLNDGWWSEAIAAAADAGSAISKRGGLSSYQHS